MSLMQWGDGTGHSSSVIMEPATWSHNRMLLCRERLLRINAIPHTDTPHSKVQKLHMQPLPYCRMACLYF